MKRVLQQAAATANKTVSEFLIDSALTEAAEVLAGAEGRGEDDPNMREMNREGTRLVRELLGLTKTSPGDK